MRKVIFLIIVLSLIVQVSSLDIEVEGLGPELYKEAFIKINLRRAYIYKCFKNFAKAYETYARLIEFNPSEKDYYVSLINDLKAYQEKCEFFEGFEDFISGDTNWDRYNRLYKMAVNEKDVVERIKLFKATLREKEGDIPSIKGIAKGYLKLDRHYTAKKWLKKIRVHDEDAEKLIERIDYILKREDVYMMKVKVNSASKDGSGQDYIKKITKFVDMKEYDEAIRYINTIILEEPGNYKLFYKLADIYSRLADYNKAIEQLERAIILNGKYYEAYYTKGEILIKLGKTEEAGRVFEKLVELSPVDSKYNRLAKKMLEVLTAE